MPVIFSRMYICLLFCRWVLASIMADNKTKDAPLHIQDKPSLRAYSTLPDLWLQTSRTTDDAGPRHNLSQLFEALTPSSHMFRVSVSGVSSRAESLFPEWRKWSRMPHFYKDSVWWLGSGLMITVLTPESLRSKHGRKEYSVWLH